MINRLKAHSADSHALFMCLSLLLLTGAPVCTAALTLSAKTNRPTMSTYAEGEEVRLNFSASGAKPGEQLELELTVLDAHDRRVLKRRFAGRADGAGKWRTTWNAPSDTFGFYRVKPLLNDDVTLAALGSRPEGFLTYVVVPDPATRSLYPAGETFFGMQGGFSPKVNVLPYLGIRRVLGSGQWKRIEPDYPGQIQEKIKAAREKGEPFPPRGFEWAKVTRDGREQTWKTYPIFAGLYWVPLTWDSDSHYVKEKTQMGRTVLTPEGEKYFRDYCRRFAAAVAESYPELDQHLYEISWEPIPPWGWKGSAEDLIRYYEIAYPAIHHADPKAVVTGPVAAGLHRDRFDWLETLFGKGLGQYLDAFSTHPYIALPPERHDLRELSDELRRILQRHTGRELAMIGTEQGYNTKGDVDNEIVQARGLTRANLILLGEGWRFNLAFYIVDFRNGQNYGFYYNLKPGIPWGPDRTGPKPAAAAYAAMTHILEGHRPVTTLNWLGDTALGYAYERAGSNVLAMWDFGPEPRDVTIPVGVDNVQLCDWMGNARSVACDDGMLTVTLRKEPVYVKGVSPRLWGRSAVRPVQLKQKRIRSFPGGRVEVDGRVTASLGEAVTGRLSMNLAKEWEQPALAREVNLRKNAKEEFSFTLRIPPDVEPGTAPFSLMLHDDGRPVAATGGTLQIRPPVAVSRVAPVFDGADQPGLVISLREQQLKTASGTLHVRVKGVPESRRTVKYELDAGATSAVSVPLHKIAVSPARVYPLELKVQTKAGYTLKTSRNVNFYRVPAMTDDVQVDARLTEWQDIEPIRLEGRGVVVRAPTYYSGTSDIAASLRYAWNDEALYLAYEVEDDVFMQDQTGWATWKDDCLQLNFDLDPFAVDVKTGNLLLDRGSKRRMTEIDLALTSEGPQAYRTVTFDENRLKTGLIEAALKLDVRREDGTIIYEAAIPWSVLGADRAPKAGSHIGIAATVNDRDSRKQHDPSAIGLFTLKEPDKFGILYLGAESP